MTLKRQVKIELTQEEKATLYNASEILEGIVNLLRYNKANGHTAFQEGLNISGCFWEIAQHIHNIDNEELIP